MDRMTDFIYGCETLDEVIAATNKKSLNEEQTDYAVWRWYNFKSEKFYNEEIVAQSRIFNGSWPVARVSPIPRMENNKEDYSQYYPFLDAIYNKKRQVVGYKDCFPWDLMIEYPDGRHVRYFDTKCTSICGRYFNKLQEDVIREYKESASVSLETSSRLVEELYGQQSGNPGMESSRRYSNGPRLFICFISLKDGVSVKDLKIDDNIRENFVKWLLNETDFLTNPMFATIKHSIIKINEQLIKDGKKSNNFDHVKAAIYYVIMDEIGNVHFVNGNK